MHRMKENMYEKYYESMDLTKEDVLRLEKEEKERLRLEGDKEVNK